MSKLRTHGKDTVQMKTFIKPRKTWQGTQTANGREIISEMKAVMPISQHRPTRIEHPRNKGVNCGNHYCLSQGIHSFFNHSQDSYHDNPHLSNLPEGFRED